MGDSESPSPPSPPRYPDLPRMRCLRVEPHPPHRAVGLMTPPFYCDGKGQDRPVEERLTEVEDAMHEHPTEGDSAIEERVLAVEEMLGMKGEFVERQRAFTVDAFGAGVQDMGERLSAVEAMLAHLPERINEELKDRAATADAHRDEARRVLDEFIALPIDPAVDERLKALEESEKDRHREAPFGMNPVTLCQRLLQVCDVHDEQFHAVCAERDASRESATKECRKRVALEQEIVRAHKALTDRGVPPLDAATYEAQAEAGGSRLAARIEWLVGRRS